MIESIYNPIITIEMEISNPINEYLKDAYLYNWGVGQSGCYDDHDIKIKIIKQLTESEIDMVMRWCRQVYGL